MSGAIPASLIEFGREAVVVRVQGRDKMKEYLAEMGFVEGAVVMVLSEVEGNIIFKVKGSKIALGRELSSRIFVQMR